MSTARLALGDRSAVFSPCGRYRYRLTIRWAPGPLLCVCMCNPSIANEMQNDPTVTRMIGFARRDGFGGLTVLNAFAWKATYIRDLWAAEKAGQNIVGPDNKAHMIAAASVSGRIVCAWGAHLRGRGEAGFTRMLLSRYGDLYTLGRTEDGIPRHPLMLRKDAPMEEWRP